MFCDFNLGFHLEANRTIFKTKGARNHPPTVRKLLRLEIAGEFMRLSLRSFWKWV